MEIVFSKIFKIDISSKAAIERPEYQSLENFKTYLLELLTQIGNKPPERQFKFKSEFTEVRGLISKILIEKDYNTPSQVIANRLLEKEIIAQDDLNKKKLNKDIQKGMLIISLIKMTDTAQKLIISKVDYDEFITEMTGEIVTGLSLRRKVYKALVCELNNNHEIIRISIFDTNANISVYWWDKFLELEVITTDNENTKRAFSAIEKDVLNPLNKKYKQDFLHLWNATVAYFRIEREFNLEYYQNEIIGNYTPFDNNLNISDLKTKIEKLPSKNNFDYRFLITPSEIHKNFKKTITLTNEIKLILEHDVANPSITFKKHEDVDGKYIMIKSDVGYEYVAKEIEPNYL